jgi:serine/threonine-protein kinase
VNLSQFVEQLRQSRLFTAEQLRDAAERDAEDAPAGHIADALVEQGLLTGFQARTLLAGGKTPLVLGQYRLLDELGRGGMGHVYKAHHTIMDRTVALKLLDPKLQQHEVAQGWFEREVRTLTRLQHPNIVLAYDANEVEGMRFLVMEYVEGQNLHERVRGQGPLSVPLACEMMAQAAQALQYAHGMRLVHRDIKPGNLLIPAVQKDDAGGEAPLVKIVDFGLASLRGPANADTIVVASPEQFVGTPDFVAPEQCRDVHAADIRSDLYSLGCTFYFALTGRPPFSGRSVAEKLANHLFQAPPLVTALRPEVPAAVVEIILRLMAKDPARRFQTPADLAQALRPCCGTHDAALAVKAAPVSQVPDFLASLHADAPPTALAAAPAAEPAVEAVGAESIGRPAEEEMPDAAAPAVRDAWRWWTDAVAAFHNRRRPSLDDAGYRRLQEGLLATCRNSAASGPQQQRAFYRRLEEIVKPWVSLQSLERTEPELLASLMTQCRRAERDLGIRRPGRRLVRWLRLAAAPALGLWLLVQGFAAGARIWSSAASGVGRLNFPSVLASLQIDSLPGQIAIGLPLVVLAAILLIRR